MKKEEEKRKAAIQIEIKSQRKKERCEWTKVTRKKERKKERNLKAKKERKKERKAAV